AACHSGIVISRFVFGFNAAEVDQQGPSRDVLAGHKAPVTAVQTLVAIIAEDEITIARHDQLSILDENAQLPRPGAADVLIAPVAAREIIAKRVGEMFLKNGIRLSQSVPIDIDAAVPQTYAVARKADDALDEVLRRVLRIVKDDDVAMAEVSIGK